MAGGWIKSFVVRMVRLSSELPEQKIFYQIAILDAGDEEYMSQVGRFIFDEDEEELVMKCISNKNPTYDRRDNLTLIIHLFYIEPVEADADRITLATVGGKRKIPLLIFTDKVISN